MCRKNPGDASVAKMQSRVPFGKKIKLGRNTELEK